MKCAKCGHDNPDTNQFCARCHAPAHFVCPACKHSQDHGGTCDQCGVDYMKYATMLIFQGQKAVQEERLRKKGRYQIFRQILLLPITGGWSLLKYLRQPKDGF